MDKQELENLLKEYADAAYWYGENTGMYGDPEPEAHLLIVKKIWELIEELRT